MREEKGLSMRMTEIVHRVLHVALTAAVEEDAILKRNPCEMLKDKPRARYNPLNRPILARERIPDVLGAVDGTLYHLPFLIAVTTGMRRSEIVGLRWCNVDVEEGVIHVREQLQPDKQNKLTIQPPKTDSSNRDILLPSDLALLLRQHKQTLRAEGEEFVCLGPRRRSLRPDDLDHAWAKVRTQLKLPKGLKFHDIRHSWANWQAESGTDIKTVSVILGHKDERVTLGVYRSVTKQMRLEAARAMEGIAGATECAATSEDTAERRSKWCAKKDHPLVFRCSPNATLFLAWNWQVPWPQDTCPGLTGQCYSVYCRTRTVQPASVVPAWRQSLPGQG